jgi:hypothetical protein
MQSCYVILNFAKCSILQLLAHSNRRPAAHGFISGPLNSNHSAKHCCQYAAMRTVL